MRRDAHGFVGFQRLAALALALCGVVTEVVGSFVDFGHGNTCGVGDTQFLKIIPVRCHRLALSEAKVEDRHLKRLGHLLKYNTKVSFVDLSRNRITDVGAKALAAGLRVNRSVRHLVLSNNRLTESGGTAMGWALEKNNVLEELDLGHNKIKAHGSRAIASGITQNKHSALHTLNLEGNAIGDHGAQHFARALVGKGDVRLSVLTSLSLRKNDITPIGVADLSEVLGTRECMLEHLDLGYNEGIGDVGVTKLGESLLTNQHLASLVLSRTKMSEMGMGVLAGVLKKNKVITTLSLAHNALLASGGSLLASGLSDNAALLSLDINAVQLGDEGARQIGLALRHNRDLKELYMSENNIGNQGANGLAAGLMHNSVLRLLALTDNIIGDEGIQYLIKAVRLNSRLDTIMLSHNLASKSLVKELQHEFTAESIRSRTHAAISHGAEADDTKYSSLHVFYAMAFAALISLFTVWLSSSSPQNDRRPKRKKRRKPRPRRMKFRRKSSREMQTSDDEAQDSLLSKKREGGRTKDSDVSLPGVGDSSEDENSFRLPVRELNAAHGPHHSESADDDSDRSKTSPAPKHRSLSTSGRARLRSPYGVRRTLPRRNSAPKTDVDQSENELSLGSPNGTGRDLADVI